MILDNGDIFEHLEIDMTNDSPRDQIRVGILQGDAKVTREAVQKAIEKDEAPLVIINAVLNPALKEVGDRFDQGEMYLPELILSAEAMEAAVEILKPLLEKSGKKMDVPGRVVMATVQGDIHDIGKNIVTALLRANSFEVLDLGKDVTAAEIVSKAEAFEADIIGLSALLSTTLPYCRDTINLLQEKGLRDKYKVFIGGGAVTPEYAKKTGADYGGAHAEAGVSNMLKALGRE
jgi:5-methyltetrahydrofolate--homocysteine methyltransferase